MRHDDATPLAVEEGTPGSGVRAARQSERGSAGVFRPMSDVLLGGAQVVVTLLASPLLRRRFNRWGADADEVGAPMPGDDLVPAPRLGYTRALTIDAPVHAVWPWLAQMGQGRGGLYSYDGLENLVGCGIHSADDVLPGHQDVRPGGIIRLGPEGYPSFRVHGVTPPTTLVLVSTGPEATYPRPRAVAADPVVTWQWTLRPVDAGRRTRLVVRQRLAFPRSQRVLWRLVEPIGFVMERRMLHGIKRRAERR
jgi:hypothetical protein